MIDRELIEHKLNLYTMMHGKHHIRDDGVVDVDGQVTLYAQNLEHIPVQFGVTYDFHIWGGGDLESLEGCPQLVKGRFSCKDGLFQDLTGGPREVKQDYTSVNIYFHSLEGSPDTIGGVWHLSYNDKIPLLRTLVAQGGVDIMGRHYSPTRTYSELVLLQDILNDSRWMGQGKRKAMMCAAALIKAGFRDNARW
jgi:hypothetical protein